MADQNLRPSPYRWVVLFGFMLMMAMQQLLWITFAPITSSAAAYYKVSDLSIGILSMIFMIVYIIVSIPASWLIDTWGFRIAVGIGAVFTGVFGALRGMAGPNYNLVFVYQLGIAVGQPLVVNAVTKVAARWFPPGERATVAGLAWLAAYIGIIIGMALTPFLTIAYGITRTLLYYGIISAASAVIFLGLARETPQVPLATTAQEEKALVFEGLKHLLVKKEFVLLMMVFFVGMGIFNGLATWIEDILKPGGFSLTQVGVIGGLMIASGILGSGIMPLLSDKFRNRTLFILCAIAGSVPGMIGLTFTRNYWVAVVSACLLGFFLLSTAPIGFQYGSEIAYPAPEGTSTGMLMMMGQISGILFIYGMDAFRAPKTGVMTASMIVLIGLMLLTTFACTRLRESQIFQQQEQ